MIRVEKEARHDKITVDSVGDNNDDDNIVKEFLKKAQSSVGQNRRIN